MDRFVMSDIGQNSSIHFIGIGGISMSGLAQIALKDGYRVTGSDWNESDITRKLEQMGAKIVYGHDAVNEDGIKNASLVVYTAAVHDDNPEMIASERKVVTQGSRGYVVDAYRVVYSQGKEISREKLKQSKYNPTATTVKVGTMAVSPSAPAEGETTA